MPTSEVKGEPEIEWVYTHRFRQKGKCEMPLYAGANNFGAASTNSVGAATVP